MLNKLRELREKDPKKFKVYMVCIIIGIITLIAVINVAITGVCEHEYTVIEEVAPTYTEDGKVVKECSLCGDKKTETVSALTPDEDDGFLQEGLSEVGSQLPNVESDDLENELVALGFTQEEAAEYREVFLMCGVTSIKGAEPSSTTATINDLICYRIVMDDDRTLMFTIDKRELFYIALNGTDVYDTSKGGFLININDIHIPENDISISTAEKLRDLTIRVVEPYFKNALYFDGFRYGRSDDKYMVQCEVYAKNGFGVKDWIFAKVWYDYDGTNFVITGIVVNGVRYK